MLIKITIQNIKYVYKYILSLSSEATTHFNHFIRVRESSQKVAKCTELRFQHLNIS